MKVKLQGLTIGGNAVIALAASCPIELSRSENVRDRRVSSRPQVWSSDVDDGPDRKGKDVGRRAMRANPLQTFHEIHHTMSPTPATARPPPPQRSLGRAEGRGEKGATDQGRTESQLPAARDGSPEAWRTREQDRRAPRKGTTDRPEVLRTREQR